MKRVLPGVLILISVILLSVGTALPAKRGIQVKAHTAAGAANTGIRPSGS